MDVAKTRAPEIEAPLREALGARAGRYWDAATGIFLFLATAAVVLWQNSRLAVLWDLSYILENSFRISIGDIPYRDFVLPYAPLTFLTQAALIKLTGRVFLHHVLYCAVMGGLATVLAWRIILNLLREKMPSPALGAFLLSAPLIVLGIYCIYPHPFYDSDCTMAILVCIYLLQKLDRQNFPPILSFLVGPFLVVPLFVKQNTGLAFLASVALALVALLGLALWRGRPVLGYVATLTGIATGFALATLLIHFTAGLANYVHWTIEFAESRRLPPLRDMLGVYRNELIPWWIAAFTGAVLIWRFNRKGNRLLAILSASLMTLPFVWPAIYLLIDRDASERAERLLDLWPFLLIVSCILAISSARRRIGISIFLAFIIIGTVQGDLLSQQVWGSTYAIWPLFVILLADAMEALSAQLSKPIAWEFVSVASVLAISMVFSGGFYVRSHERLDYAKVSEGEMEHSTLPALRGLSMRGPWIPQSEELVRYSDREIPRDDGILMIPGEDLFYFTTGRHPRLPVLMFDHTVNPYSPEEILHLARERQIRWLVVKRDLQLGSEPVENKARLLDLLSQDFGLVERLDDYDIYRRKGT